MILHINPFQYFDQKLLTEVCEEKTFFDFTEILQKRKLEYPKNFFIVTQNNQVKMMDNYLLNFISIGYTKNILTVNINQQIDKPLYWIDIHNEKNTTSHLNVGLGINQSIIHEDIACEKSHSYLFIENKGNLNYYNLVNSHTHQLFYKELEVYNFGFLKAYFMQKEKTAKVKIDTLVKLFENATSDINILNLISENQLKDDCCEIQHIGKNTKSDCSYLCINSGKAVSQINNIIEKKSTDSQLTQQIKHILNAENAQSFSKPSLMIHAPTVASHGNTISSFPEEWLFYLYQKGMSPVVAKQIIKSSMVQNFCSKTNYENQFYSYFLGTNHDNN